MKHFLLPLLASTLLTAAPLHFARAAGEISPNSVDKSFSLQGESLFSADEIRYDKEAELVTATGNVEVVQGGRVLKADKILYDIRQDKITADGNIVLLEPSGEVLFADNIELFNELKTGAIRDLRVLFTDNSRLAAQSAVRVDENRTEMNNAVYSTCRLCETDRNAAPLWQVKSSKVIHDKADKSIVYKHAVMEFYGVPVLYTPYFSHPDPTVKRKSGFMAPSTFSTSELGYGVSAPYYYVISEDKDATITPTVTTKEGVLMAGEYRQAFETGDLILDGSLTYVDERTTSDVKTGNQEFQGHLRGLGEFDIDKTWSWGFDFFATTTDTFLDKYDISNEDTLTSTAYIQGLRGRNYTKLSAYSFQGLQSEDETGTTPIVPAWLEYSYVGEPDKYGSRFNANVDTLALVRTDGQDTTRVSVEGGWHLPYTSSIGEVYTLNASLRGDTYYTQDQLTDPYDLTSDSSNELSARAIPSISLKWSFPFARQSGSVRQVIEPIVEGVWSKSFDSGDTPNEDSLSFEFDDTNLFGSNRNTGLDEVEEGARLNYGVNFGFYGESGGYTSLLVGQSLHENDDTSFAEGTGLEDQWSDFVSRLEIQPTDLLKYTQRIRFDQKENKLARNEIDLNFGTEKNWISVGYLNLREESIATDLQKRDEIYLEGKVALSEYWSGYGGYRRDLDGDGSSIDGKIGLEYLDECFGFALEAKRSFTRDRDVDPNTSIAFKIRLLPFN